MGLHLNFELRLASDVSRAAAAFLLDRLRDVAATKAVDYVSPLFDLSMDGDDAPDDRDRSARRYVRFCAECLAHPLPDEDIPRYTGDPCSAIAFAIDPGRGSEWATFGLMQRHAEGGGPEEWFWWCGCKTQYASVVSDDHLIAVHSSLVAILDSAVEPGGTRTSIASSPGWIISSAHGS